MKRLLYGKGEESAVVDSSVDRSKISRIDPSSNLIEKPQEDSLPTCTMTEFGQNEFKTDEFKRNMEEEKEEINDPPGEEGLPIDSCDSPKIVKRESSSIIIKKKLNRYTMVKASPCLPVESSKFSKKFEKKSSLNQFDPTKCLPIDSSGAPKGDSLRVYRINELGHYELIEKKGSREKLKIDREPSIFSSGDKDINQAIDIAIRSSKLVGAQAVVMKGALKMVINGVATVDKIAEKYRFSKTSSFYDLIKKSRLFLLVIRGNGSNIKDPVESSYNKAKVDSLDPTTIEIIRDVISKITVACQGDERRKEQLKAAIYAVCNGEMTVKEASDSCHLQTSTLLIFLHNLRISLTSILPQQQLTSIPLVHYLNDIGRIIDNDEMVTIREEASVTIEGITVPNSIMRLSLWLSIGRLNYSRAQPFFGTGDGLRKKLLTIFQHFRMSYNVMNVVDAIMHFYVYNGSILEACEKFKINKDYISTCIRVTRIFVDFSKTSCTFPSHTMANGILESNQLLPRPPVERKMNEFEMKKEMKEEYGLIKEEPIEPPLPHEMVNQQEIQPPKYATHTEVSNLTNMVLDHLPDESRRPAYFIAVMAVLMGKKTINEAAQEREIRASIVREYMLNVRWILGNRCPPQKFESNNSSSEFRRVGDEKSSPGVEYVTIYGITVPNSISLAAEYTDYSRAQPFLGTKERLREKMISILEYLNMKDGIENIVDTVMHVHVYHRSFFGVQRNFKKRAGIIAYYFRIFKIFINFELSPCASQTSLAPLSWRNANNGKVAFPSLHNPAKSREVFVPSGIMKFPQLLPRPPVERNMNEMEMKEEIKEEIKEEPIDD